MIQGVLFGLMLAAPAAPTAIVERATAAAAKAGRKVLRRCGTDEAQFLSAPDDDWTPVPSAEVRHAALRTSLGEPMPAARTHIRIHAVGGDLQTTDFSVILTLGGHGIWNGTAVGQSKIWIEGAKPSLMPRKAWTVPVEKGRRLDILLSDKCFYAEPTDFSRHQVPAVGGLYFTLETLTPSHQRRVSYKGGKVEGLTKEVAALTFPPDP